MEKLIIPEGTTKEYILSFSSFYKAAYAQDMLEEGGIASTLKKLPPALIRSCGTGLYLRTDSIQPVQQVLDEKQISTRGIYQIQRDGGREKRYVRMK